MSTAADAPCRPKAAMAWTMLGIMTLCYTFAFVDRQILNLLAENIIDTFELTDAQLGFLLGPAFTVSYVALGLPAGWCADRFNRRNLVLFAGLIWSFGTISAGFVQSYEALIVTRVIVGGSEAFLFPAGISLVADLFGRKQLPTATSVFLLSPYFGAGFALIMGGAIVGLTADMAGFSLPVLGTTKGWQLTLTIVGVIGALPVLALLFMKEPERAQGGEDARDSRRFSLLEGAAYMFGRWKFYVMFFVGMSCSSLILNTVPAWAPTFLIREFGMTTSEVGLQYGVMVLIMGVAGGLSAPLINSVLSKRHDDAIMRTVRLGPAMLVIAALLLILSGSRLTSMGSLGLLAFAYSFPLTVAGAALQLATPARLRGMAAAFYFITVSVVGMGIGPTLVPAVTQGVFGNANAIGDALGMIAIVFGVCAFSLLTVAMIGFRGELNKQRQTAWERA